MFFGQPGFDKEFVNCLECAEILKSIAISKNLEGFRDAKGLRHLVCRWSPSLHTFFFFVYEFTITLEDVVNNFLLLVFGDKNPFDIHLLKVKDRLFNLFGGRIASFRGKPARMGKWVATLSQKKDKMVRRARFLTPWLSKFLFNDFPKYGIKSTFFPLPF